MKTLPAGLSALLATRRFFIADCYEFTLYDGTILRYTSADVNLTFSGHTFLAGGTTGPFMERKDDNARVKQKIGTEVDTLQFSVMPGSATVLGFPLLKAARLGIFDAATVTLYRVYMSPTDFTTVYPVTMFVGRMAEVDIGRTFCIFNVNSHLELLNQNMPRNLYQAGCLNSLFDGACTLSKAAYAVSGAAAAGSTVSTINATLSQTTGYFTLGTVQFTSGQNSGFTRSVKSFTTGGNFTLLVPLPFTPAAGDTFTIYPGCSKTLAACAGFGNSANFRGFPMIPEAETGI